MRAQGVCAKPWQLEPSKPILRHVDRSEYLSRRKGLVMSKQRNGNAKRPVALVTGATSGIGRAIALKLAGDGFYVIVHGRDLPRGRATVGEIEANGGHGRFISANLSIPSDVDRLATEVGEIDVLINNASIAWFGPTADLDTETFDAPFATNVRAAYFLVAALAPGMAQRGSGTIINLGSMAGQIGLAGGAAYSATKPALTALTRSWAAEASPSGVRVNTIAPGPVFTDGVSRELTRSLAAPPYSSAGRGPRRSPKSQRSWPRRRQAT